jgi:hypothetical protein
LANSGPVDSSEVGAGIAVDHLDVTSVLSDGEIIEADLQSLSLPSLFPSVFATPMPKTLMLGNGS